MSNNFNFRKTESYEIYDYFCRYLYAIGGQDGGSCLDLVERYDPVQNRWERKASMKTRRLGVGVAVLNKFVYAVGGSDGGKPWASVEKYSPSFGS